MSHHYIKYEGIRYRYPGSDRDVLKDVTFTVTHGEHVALLGLNGSGKSTLLLQSNGLLFPDSGRVVVGDVPVTSGTVKEIRRRVGIVFQNPEDMLFMPTVAEDVGFGPRNMDLPEEEVERRIGVALEAVGLSDKLTSSTNSLSGGEKRSAAIATVLSMEPDILLMDEPSANLDLRGRNHLMRIISEFHHTVILASHDLEMALELCPRALLLNEGELIADGDTPSVVELLKEIASK